MITKALIHQILGTERKRAIDEAYHWSAGGQDSLPGNHGDIITMLDRLESGSIVWEDEFSAFLERIDVERRRAEAEYHDKSRINGLSRIEELAKVIQADPSTVVKEPKCRWCDNEPHRWG